MTGLLDIVGQDEALCRLQQALTGQRLPHAFLFAGPAGVGRRTTAAALARLLLCHAPATRPNDGRLDRLDDDFALRQACGTCRSCALFEAGTHNDLQWVYKELGHYHEDQKVRGRKMQELSIDVIRTFLIAPAGRAAVGGRGKVFVVLEADLMSSPAQNALLKTLEEPPGGVTIILVAERPEDLLPTTRSRCALVRFGRLPGDFVRSRLAEANVPAAEARFWAAFTGGSLGRSLRLSARGLYAVKTEIVGDVAALDPAGDAALGVKLTKITEKLAAAEVAEAKKLTQTDLAQTLASRRAVGLMLELLASAFRDALTIAVGADRPLVHADQADEVSRIAGRLDATRLAEVVDQIARYEHLLWRNASPKVIWDNLVITCASAAPLSV
jgi:DNA polymerase-3 subunit delta'